MFIISTITEVDKTQNFPCDNYVFRNTVASSCNIYTYDIILLLKLVARRDDELLVLSVRLRWQKCSEDTTDLQSLLLVLLDQRPCRYIWSWPMQKHKTRYFRRRVRVTSIFLQPATRAYEYGNDWKELLSQAMKGYVPDVSVKITFLKDTYVWSTKHVYNLCITNYVLDVLLK